MKTNRRNHHNIFWTVILTGSASMLAIGFGWDAGAENKPYVVAVVVGTIWATTIFTMFGLRSTGWVGTVGALAGTILPAVVLVAFAVVFLAQGNESNAPLEAGELVPDLGDPSTFAFAVSTIMVFSGIEVMGTRVQEIREPARTYPRATFSAIGAAALVLIPTVVAIAALVPAQELNITAGIVQAMETVFDSVWHLWWVPALFAVALLIDAVGEIAGWMAGTPVAMAKATERGYLPSRLASVRNQVARPMLVTQAIVGSLISIVFVTIPSVQGVFWVLAVLLVQLYLLMYVLLFAAAWWLRRRQPDRVRQWRVPGGAVGITVVCGIGLVAAGAAFALGFVPPASLDVGTANYLVVLGAGLALSLTAPAVLVVRRRRRLSP